MNVFAQLPQKQRNAFALVLERGKDPADARRVTCKPGFGELKNIEARHIGDGVLDRGVIELALRKEETDLFELLSGGQEVPLGRVGEKLKRLGRCMLLLPLEA